MFCKSAAWGSSHMVYLNINQSFNHAVLLLSRRSLLRIVVKRFNYLDCSALCIFSPSLPWPSSWSFTTHLFLKHSSHQPRLRNFLNLLPPLLLPICHIYHCFNPQPSSNSSFTTLSILITPSTLLRYLYCLNLTSVFSVGSTSPSHTV